MQINRRFTLMALPQMFSGSELTLNIVLLPRNQNPFAPAIEGNTIIPNAPAFAAAQPRFEAKIISGLGTFPNDQAAGHTVALPVTSPVQAANVFSALAQQFKITNPNPSNASLESNPDRAGLKPARASELSVRKHLPLSYRHAFNFTSPRTPNASLDDSYSCAVRGAAPSPTFQRTGDDVSWGKVFAYALRQPLLATQLGMIYSTTLPLDPAFFEHGGWLYIDLAAGSDYVAQQSADPDFVKRYAARIPPLTAGTKRQVFAPLLLPVLVKTLATDPVPDGTYDTIFTEVAEYDDGFAKIAHAFQPPSANLLAETSDGAHPVKDAGIRLGWDDEQILIWFMRQMSIDPTVTVAPDKRLDALLAVFGYAVDAREVATPANPWESLTHVTSKASLQLPFATAEDPEGSLEIGAFDDELPFQVYPTQLDGDATKSFWLPMYFAAWHGNSMVLPDADAAQIYQNTDPAVLPGSATATSLGTGTTGPAKQQANGIYDSPHLLTALRYGQQYEFRIRLRDLSGGGPPNDPAVLPINASPSNIARTHFKRFVAPQKLRIQYEELHNPVNTDQVISPNSLNVGRPLLGYPAVNFTGKYADPVALLTQASLDMAGKEAFGIEDPDVDQVEVTVEVETLRMDNLLSVSGKDNYILLYKTRRGFAPVASEADYKDRLILPLVYKDCKVLHTGAEVDLTADFALRADINQLKEIVVPTARNVRITLRAVCEQKTNDSAYYGLTGPDPEMDTRFGRVSQVRVYRSSTDESGLFLQSPPDMIRGIYLQPDPPAVFDGSFSTALFGKTSGAAPTLVQRLARQLKLESSGMTLLGGKGERVQFGCSSRIRHSLSPESSSLTISANGDLMHHWLCCITVDLNRDWMWNALAPRSFVIERTVRFRHDTKAEAETETVGDIEVRHTASFESLHEPQRDFTRLVFLDAVEPKNERMRPSPHNNEPRLPDSIVVSYTITPKLLPDATATVTSESLLLDLPITTPPAQMPAIVSAGIALSKYHRNKTYSASEPRRRFLWIEFAEPLHDPQDTYFARVLAYAPDQLLSNNHPELLFAPDEPALPIDPELIRTIAPPADAFTLPTNDLAALGAMQPMERSTDSDRHFLLPLPPGLHADAAEMFGFFTYEFRVGHYRSGTGADTEMSWCTAQGRFGRPLRVTGIQHPAPTLLCTVERNNALLYVVAPFATAVHQGADVTADPPRTQLCALLYAQVQQADRRDYLNVLLDDKALDHRIQVDLDPNSNARANYTLKERVLLKNISVAHWKDEIDYAQAQYAFKLKDTSQSGADATRYGTAAWSNTEVEQLLRNYGLPANSPMSVVVVEMLPTIRNFKEAVTATYESATVDRLSSRLQIAIPRQQQSDAAPGGSVAVLETSPGQLSDELGQHRILRTSPLTPVPYIC